MSRLAEIYKKAMDEIHHFLNDPISATSPSDPTGLGGKIGKQDSKTEAQKALDEAEASAQGQTTTAQAETTTAKVDEKVKRR